MALSAENIASLRTIVDAAVAGETPKIPGAVFVVVNREGKVLFSHASGRRGLASSMPMTLETVFWIASSTKMLTGVACMKLVEQGTLRLDDSVQLESLCPELRNLPVLGKDGSLTPKRKGITLRMLLSHTAGFGYTFFNEQLRDWSHPAGLDEFSGSMKDMMQPLLFQPGEGWEYGVCYISSERIKPVLGTGDVNDRLSVTKLVPDSSMADQYRLGRHCPGASHRHEAQRLYTAEHLSAAGPQAHEHDSHTGYAE
jgi:hypothetical protein